MICKFPKILYKVFVICLLSFALLSCSKFDFDDGDKRSGDDSDRGRGTSRFDRDVLPFEELKPDLFAKNCGGYQSDAKSFRFSEAVLKDKYNYFKKAENCLLWAMDRSLKPICDEERILKEELKEGRYSNEDNEEIEERLESLEEFKYEYSDTFYEIADNTDETYEIIKGVVDDKVTDPVPNLLIDVFWTREFRGFGDAIARRARKLCGYNLRKRDREDD